MTKVALPSFTELVAVDDGYAQVKVWRQAAAGLPEIRLLVPTAFRSGKDGVTGLDGTAVGDSYETEGETFVAGTGLTEETRWDGYHVSAMNRVSVHHGLAQAGLFDARLQLVAGLPVREYFRNGARNAAFINSKIESLKKPVLHHSGRRVDISGVIIAPQAIAVFADWAMDENFKLRDPDLKSAEIAVVDIGGRTTDIAVITRAGSAVDHARSGTENIGILDVVLGIERGLREKFDLPDERLPQGILMNTLRTGEAKLFGRLKPAQDVVEMAKREIQAKVRRLLQQKLGSAVSLHSVLFVGGGALAMKELAADYPNNGMVINDPEFANARGMFRLGQSSLIRDTVAKA